jgi:hypothetical protein
MADPHSDKSVGKTTGLAFLSILLALILKTALDTFFAPARSATDVKQMWELARVDPLRNCLFLLQWIVLVFTLVRFYFGAFRYYQERADDTTHSVIRDFVGQILVFISFYFAAVLVRTVGVFYLAILIIHIVDGIWFFLAKRSEDKPVGIKSVASAYFWLDILTILGILVGAAVATKWPTSFYLWQFICLVFLFLLGLWDFICLAPFYGNQPDWQAKIRLWRCGLPVLPKPWVGVSNRPETPTHA